MPVHPVASRSSAQEGAIEWEALPSLQSLVIKAPPRMVVHRNALRGLDVIEIFEPTPVSDPFAATEPGALL